MPGPDGGEPEPQIGPQGRPARSKRGGKVGGPQREQEGLWSEVLGLAAYVEASLRAAIAALCENRTDLIAEVRAEEMEIDRWEVRIEQICLRALALYELVASDLRRVVAALRINRELEGLSDLAENIANRSRKLNRDSLTPQYLPRLRVLADAALRQVDASLVSLRTLDSLAARSVIQADNEVDRLREEIVEELKAGIRQDPERVGSYLRLINSARNLERAADHASKIASAVVYAKEGVIIHAGHEDEA